MNSGEVRAVHSSSLMSSIGGTSFVRVGAREMGYGCAGKVGYVG